MCKRDRLEGHHREVGFVIEDFNGAGEGGTQFIGGVGQNGDDKGFRAFHITVVKRYDGDFSGVGIGGDGEFAPQLLVCLLYTSDAADDLPCVDLGCRPIIKKKNKKNLHAIFQTISSVRS